MSKDYTATKMDEITVRMRIPAYCPETGKYHAGSMQMIGIAKNGVMKAPVIMDMEYLGSEKDVPWTPHEIYTALTNYNNFNTMLANKLKDLYVEGINEDIST
jgi:hypothetical protein